MLDFSAKTLNINEGAARVIDISGHIEWLRATPTIQLCVISDSVSGHKRMDG